MGWEGELRKTFRLGLLGRPGETKLPKRLGHVSQCAQMWVTLGSEMLPLLGISSFVILAVFPGEFLTEAVGASIAGRARDQQVPP